MLEGAEAARRRELQLRAYAPGGALTDAEAAELRDLDARNLTAPVVAPPTTEPTSAREDGFRASALWAGSSEEPRRTSSDAEPELPAADPEPVRAPEASARRRFPQRLLIPVIAIVAVVLGLVAGRLVFGEHSPMTAAQQAAWAKLDASGTYEPGSLRLVGSEYGVDAWKGTQAASELECLILTREGGSDDPNDGYSAGCLNPDQRENGEQLQANLDYTEKRIQYSVWAAVVEDIDGELAVVMQRQNMTEGFDWRSMYGASELAMVSVLEDAGFAGQMLNILGYDGDTPVWSGVDDEQRQCLMVVQGAEVVQQCGGPARIEPLELTIGDTTYAIEQTLDRGDALTIYRGTGVQG
ncbi:hypothetical protein ACTJJ4_06925 [Microbacterium sp. 22195]|uniref:hypothetical protein n=1 Tax=Microbacterium sp. 22195 TaxID=3453891 RepID=UPI003F84FE8A